MGLTLFRKKGRCTVPGGRSDGDSGLSPPRGGGLSCLEALAARPRTHVDLKIEVSSYHLILSNSCVCVIS